MSMFDQKQIVEYLAAKFRAKFDAGELVYIDASNAQYPDEDYCASHDHQDPNIYFDSAMEEAGWSIFDDHDCIAYGFFNLVWDRAFPKGR